METPNKVIPQLTTQQRQKAYLITCIFCHHIINVDGTLGIELSDPDTDRLEVTHKVCKSCDHKLYPEI